MECAAGFCFRWVTQWGREGQWASLGRPRQEMGLLGLIYCFVLFPPGECIFSLCPALLSFGGSRGLSYPNVKPSSLALVTPIQSREGAILSFAFKNLYLPASPFNKSQLHLCPKLQVACLSWTFILFGVGRNCSFKCHI